MNIQDFSFLCRTKTCFGKKALGHLPFELNAMGGSTPFVLQDKTSEASGCTGPLIKAFRDSDMTLGIYPGLEDGDPMDIGRLKEIYQLFQYKGFDCIIALGGDAVCDAAKVLNLIVTAGPEILQQAPEDVTLTQPLMPLVFLPSVTGTGRGTNCSATAGPGSFRLPELAPDIALMDPALMADQPVTQVVDHALACLAACCETFVLSDNPPARAYAVSGIQMIRHHLFPLLEIMGFPDEAHPCKTKETVRHRVRLVHASVITGYLMANRRPMISAVLGRAVSEKTGTATGNAMMIVLPALFSAGDSLSRGLDRLLLSLSGQEIYSGTPSGQRALAALFELQSMLNSLYLKTNGKIYRTLTDTGLTTEHITEIAQGATRQSGGSALDPRTLESIVARCCDARPTDQE